MNLRGKPAAASCCRYAAALIEIEAYSDLCCPACSGMLRLEPFTTEHEAGVQYVSSGVVVCERCRVLYPIESDTPVMLRFTTPFHDWFLAEHQSELAPFSEYSVPHEEPRRGEKDIQETFTDEWQLIREDDLAYSYTEEELEDYHRHCSLRYMHSLPEEGRPRSLLDAGCGGGIEAKVLKKVTRAEQTFGIDLNFALLSRRAELRRQPGLNFVIASLFDLPFARERFDLVVSQGVLHHTYSTHDAFRSISTRVRKGGFLYAWVYALEDHLVPPPGGWWGTRHPLIERIARPPISRAPRPIRNAIFKLLTLVAHLLPIGRDSYGRARHGDEWGRANTEHAIRDWLSPRYAWRHGFNEVTEWFESEGYTIVDVQSSLESQRLFGRPLFGIGMTGQKTEE